MHKLTGRNVIHVIASFSASTTGVFCPALLNAQPVTLLDWDGIPTDRPIGEDRLVEVDAGPVELDITELQPGEVAVIARPTEDPEYSGTGMTQFIAIHRRTEEQIAFGETHDREGTVQDPRYFVVSLVCTHRGSLVGLTGNPEAPFACTDRRGRHSSVFDPTGLGISGASENEYLPIPDYVLTEIEGRPVLRFA